MDSAFEVGDVIEASLEGGTSALGIVCDHKESVAYAPDIVWAIWTMLPDEPRWVQTKFCRKLGHIED